MTDQKYALLGGVILWIAVPALILWVAQKQQRPFAGLVLNYMVGMTINYLLAASLYALPWYGSEETELVWMGFQVSLYGMVGFGAGVLTLWFLPALFKRRNIYAVSHFAKPAETITDQRLIPVYMAVGLAGYQLTSLLQGVATVTAIISSSIFFLVVGLCLGCWQLIRTQNLKGLLLLVGGGMLLPLSTILFSGFLGYGLMLYLSVLIFIFTKIRVNTRMIVGGVVIAYLGLSLYISYMSIRDDIRDAVWGGASYSARTGEVQRLFSEFQLFNPTNEAHLYLIDRRQNQARLIGYAVDYIDAGYASFARGDTLWQAVAALIPRALWPEKTIRAGSGDLVSQYTGLTFSQNTSVGIGHILEFYINFGSAGVAIGLFILGFVLAYFDGRAMHHLVNNYWPGFAKWFILGMPMLQVGGSLVELTAGVAAAAIMGQAATYFVVRFVLPLRLKPMVRSTQFKPQVVPKPAVGTLVQHPLPPRLQGKSSPWRQPGISSD